MVKKLKILYYLGEVQSQLKQLTSKPVSAPATLACELYYTARTKQAVRITKNDKILLDRALPHIKQLCKGSSIEVIFRGFPC